VVKSELVRVLNEKVPELQQRDVESALNCILGQMTDALDQGERIEIRGFGSFNLRHRLPRIARNPKTGEAVNLPAKVAVHFKPGKEMRVRVDAARDKCASRNEGLTVYKQPLIIPKDEDRALKVLLKTA
jgi:integration host factor subunit beta